MKSLTKKLQWPDGFKLYDKLFFGIVFVFAFFFMSHPDLWETANHSYVFLESVFSGNFMNFYEFCAAHNNSYYYINVANYNIMIYMLFGLWELPVFIFNHIFGLPLNEMFIIYWAKIVCVGFFTGCGYMVKRLCMELGLKESKASLTAMFFIFNPVAFFSPMAMGQYDTLCLFFTLWALCLYVKGDMTKFSLIMGVGVVFKFFPLMILVPLVLVREKKILNIIKYGIMSLWLYIPTTLLFWGRTGNAAVFTQAMINRMFQVTDNMGMREIPVFILLYALVVFVSFLYVPKNKKTGDYLAVYIPMVVFCLLFNYIYWHPQWLVLMIPFVVITTQLQENKAPWYYMDIVMAAGFFLFALYNYSSQTGAVLFDGGLLCHLFGVQVITSPDWRPLADFMVNIPYVWITTPVLFTGSIIGNIVLKLPVGNGSLADRLSDKSQYDKIPDKVFLYGIFVMGFLGFWLAPSLLELINAIGVI